MLPEKPTAVKLNILNWKGRYLLVLSLAETQGLDETSVAGIQNNMGTICIPRRPFNWRPYIAAAALPDSKFCHVALTARLINSYMSMFYWHHRQNSAIKFESQKLYNDLSVRRSTRTYVGTLEICGYARKSHERHVAKSFAEQLWKDGKLWKTWCKTATMVDNHCLGYD